MSIIIAFLLVLGLPFVLRKYRNGSSRLKHLLFSILIGYLLAVLFITLGHRTTDYAGETNLILFSTFRKMFTSTVHRIQEWGFPSGLRELKWVGYKSWESVILNLLMLVPLGYLVPLCFLRMQSKWKMLLTGFGLSLLIETLQLITHRGWFDVDDIFLNTLGALIGYGLYKAILRQ